MEDIQTDEAREARHLLTAAIETMPASPARTGDALLHAIGRRHARRRRTRALVSAAAVAAAAAGTAAAVLLSATVAAAPPALAAVTSALTRAAAGSFRMSVTVTQRNTVPGQPSIRSPLHITGELDLKRNLGRETLSYGWRTLIVGGKAYTQLPPATARQYYTGGKLWTEEPLWLTTPPYPSAGAQLAWDFNSDRPFDPQALLALLRSGPSVLDQGSVSGTGWTGHRYLFTVSHPKGTGRLVDRITCIVDVDSQGRVRSLDQTTVFAVSGKRKTTGETIYTTDFTFSDFGIRFAVTPPPASQVDYNAGVAVQF